MAYNQAIADYVCEQLALGRGLRTIARDKREGMPAESTLRLWAIDNADLAARYARARMVGNEMDFEKLDEWANQEPPRGLDGKVDNGWVQWNKVRIDSRHWDLAKRQPGKYGDKIEHEHKGSVNITATRHDEAL